MINDTLNEGEGEMEYVNDVLETYCQSLSISSKSFEKLIRDIE